MEETRTPDEVYNETLPSVLKAASRVLSIEKEYLFEIGRPQGVVEQLLRVFREEVE